MLTASAPPQEDRHATGTTCLLPPRSGKFRRISPPRASNWWKIAPNSALIDSKAVEIDALICQEASSWFRQGKKGVFSPFEGSSLACSAIQEPGLRETVDYSNGVFIQDVGNRGAVFGGEGVRAKNFKGKFIPTVGTGFVKKDLNLGQGQGQGRTWSRVVEPNSRSKLLHEKWPPLSPNQVINSTSGNIKNCFEERNLTVCCSSNKSGSTNYEGKERTQGRVPRKIEVVQNERAKDFSEIRTSEKLEFRRENRDEGLKFGRHEQKNQKAKKRLYLSENEAPVLLMLNNDFIVRSTIAENLLLMLALMKKEIEPAMKERPVLVGRFEAISSILTFHLGVDAKRVSTESNAGGTSTISESLSVEYFVRRFQARNVVTEMEVEYCSLNWKKVDYICNLYGQRVGVSVTRAMSYPNPQDFTPQMAYRLLYKKLFGLIVAQDGVQEKHSFSRCILHVWCETKHTAKIVETQYKDVLEELDITQDVIMVLTVADGWHSKPIFYEHCLRN